MKSSYELAMERMGGGLAQLTDEQKQKIAEVETLYKSKKAGADLAMQDRLKKAANDPEKQKQITEDYAVEIASIESKFEKEKEKIREGK